MGHLHPESAGADARRLLSSTSRSTIRSGIARTFDWDRDVAFVDRAMPFLSAMSPDLAAFKANHGKLIMYTGWADPVVPPQDAVNYYDDVVKAMGGLAATGQFFRFFPVPGMGHCMGGPGPNAFDALGALEQWSEHGAAPQAAPGIARVERRRRSHAAALRVPDGRALSRHGQHRRSGELRLRTSPHRRRDRRHPRTERMLALLGLATVVLLLVLIMSRKVSPLVALIVVPTAAALARRIRPARRRSSS